MLTVAEIEIPYPQRDVRIIGADAAEAPASTTIRPDANEPTAAVDPKPAPDEGTADAETATR